MVARHQDQLRPQYVLSQGPRLAQTPACFSVSSLERTDELRCNALRCATQHARYVDARKQRVASQGAERPLQPWSCEKKDADAVPGCLGVVAVLGAGGTLCASAVLASIASQASRRTCRRVEAEVRASRGAKPRWQRSRSYSPRTATTTRGQLSNGLATSVKRGVPCATGTVFAHWRGREPGQADRGGQVCLAVVRSADAGSVAAVAVLAVAVTVRSRCRRRDRNCKARRPCGSTHTRDRTRHRHTSTGTSTGTGTG